MLELIPWKRVAAFAGTAISAWAVLPEDQKFTKRGLALVLIGVLGGAAVPAERIFAKRKTKARPFDVEAARHRVGPLLVLLSVLGSGCGDGDVHLKGRAGDAFRAITGANAITINDKRAIYGTENPPSERLVCEEEQHKKQAAVVADALVQIDAIDNDEESRTLAWVAIYWVNWVQYGYAGNRFEQGAKRTCEAAP